MIILRLNLMFYLLHKKSYYYYLLQIPPKIMRYKELRLIFAIMYITLITYSEELQRGNG